MDINLYLKRINYTGQLAPSAQLLWQLQEAHLLNVPFENLDIHNNIKIDLLNSFNKVVLQNRGGFCYELNGLFYRLLKEIGYTVKMISARVYNTDNSSYGAEFDHMAIIATIQNEEYLVDVGFGEFALHPIKIEPGKDVIDPKGVFRIVPFDEQYLLVAKRNAQGIAVPEYIFSRKERALAEFNDMCSYHQTSSDSHFTKKRICSLPTAAGRISLIGNTLNSTHNGSVTKRLLHDENEVKQVLHDYFKIDLG
jgi:N-hydroxyarylamine O-acetyltransferase